VDGEETKDGGLKKKERRLIATFVDGRSEARSKSRGRPLLCVEVKLGAEIEGKVGSLCTRN